MTIDPKAEAKNRSYARRLGWAPAWWSAGLEHGPALAKAIAAYQAANLLEVDGVAGPATYRRIVTDRELAKAKPSGGSILVGGKHHPLEWEAVTLPGEAGHLALVSGFGRHLRAPSEIRACVVHWDATPSAAVTHRVLAGRGISTHFVIDWDGRIYQLLDVALTAWHAKGVNAQTVGVDLNNPVRPQLLGRLRAAGQPDRPVLEGFTVNGWNPGPFLGYHPIQIEALEALALALHLALGIPLTTPEQPPRALASLRGTVKPSGLSGFYHHAQVDGVGAALAGKWDSLGLDLPAIMAEAKVGA